MSHPPDRHSLKIKYDNMNKQDEVIEQIEEEVEEQNADEVKLRSRMQMKVTLLNT